MTDVSPGPIMEEIQRAAQMLDECGFKMRESIEAEAVARLAYDLKVEGAKIEIYDKAKRSGERPPAEDIRTALAHSLAQDEYAGFLKAKASVEALKAWQVSLRAATSARQTLLSTLRAESSLPSPS